MLRLIALLVLAFALLIAGAAALGSRYPAVVLAYSGDCRTDWGTCIVDGRTRRLVHWSAVNRYGDWLPDLSAMVYQSIQNIHTVSRDLTITDLTTSDAANTLPRLSPDGARVVYTQINRVNDVDLWVMDTDGGSQRQVQSNLVALGGAPVWSPDNRHLLYFTQLIDNNTNIWLLDTETGDVAPIGDTNGADASFSPDGGRVAHSGVRGGTLSIVDIHHPDTPTVVTVAQRPNIAYWVAWSPDGAQIAFIHQQQTNNGRVESVRVYDVASGEITQVTQQPHIMYAPPVWVDARTIAQPVYLFDNRTRNAVLLIDTHTARVRLIRLPEMRQFIGAVRW